MAEWLSALCCGTAGRSVRAQAIGFRALAQTSAPPMLVDTSDGYKYVSQSGSVHHAVYTWLHSVHLYLWKRQVSQQM